MNRMHYGDSGLISNVATSHGLDRWISLLSGDGVFHVRELRCLIDSKITSPMVNPTVWFHIPPVKVICFVWRACIDRIPTMMALSKRGVRVETNSCHLCSSGVDDTDHLFMGCSFAGDIWNWLCHWCARNEKVFRSTCANAPKVVDNILALIRTFDPTFGKFTRRIPVVSNLANLVFDPYK
uniref:Reverse transcriptase zinc-binding domain-containing protein n=1 Tax=Lactuca sativa TaxID=4236 RepID=A0A9R1UX94_LACSA|nr:hypothetical protein LSAT_V11C800390950 [Lactuca sativa]